MKKIIIKGILGSLLLLSIHNSFAQNIESVNDEITLTIPEISIVYIIGHRPSLTDAIKQNSKEPYTCSDHSSSYLNYVSIVSPGETNKIMVSMDGNLPKQTQLLVKAFSGTAKSGQIGIPVIDDYIELSSTPKEIITDIGSCYTGNSTQSGHRLSYTWVIMEKEPKTLISYWRNSINILYTITAN